MERSTGIWRSVTGSPFQVAGPATEKVRRCLVAVLERGTISSACASERRQQRFWTCVVKQQNSRKYGGGMYSVTLPNLGMRPTSRATVRKTLFRDPILQSGSPWYKVLQ